MEEQATFEPGARIGDVWEVIRPLGKGAMGSVYACRNKDAPGIQVAIKLLQGFAEYHPIARRRFLREAEILYGLHHPNVVSVHNIVLDSRPPYLEMELIDGRALSVEMMNGPIPMERSIEIVTQVADALAYMHRRKVYHRDIKPENLLIQPDATVKLVDFGLAKEAEGLELTLHGSTSFGTVEYCPPEWISSEPVDPASWDSYALGVLLFEMLTGQAAFQMPEGDASLAVMAVMAQKQEIEHLDPGPAFPADLRALVKHLTARKAAERLDDMRVVLRQLRAL